MDINLYGEQAVQLACSLANEPPVSLAELRSRCEQGGLVMGMRVVRGDLDATHGLIERWVGVVDADSPTVRAARLNELLAEHAEHPRVTDHAGDGWHVHYRGTRTLGGVLGAVISVGTAMHLTARGMHRLGRCATADCERVFADVSRNGRQTYCSSRCGTRAAVRRHRARAAS